MGIYVVDLHQLDVQKRTFNANFWVWSVCGNEQRQPLKTIEFTNANSTTPSLDQIHPRDRAFWAAKKIDGSFRHDWDVRNFPFDRHVLSVTMEEGNDDTRIFQ
jgi:hypothetical protein